MNDARSSASRRGGDRLDAVVIGAGVIGAATTLELSRRGWRVVCVDKTAAAGSGSTLNSSAIVRFSYSTRPGIILAWEGLHYWLNWPEYIGVDDENGLIEFRQCGKLMLLTDDADHPQRVRALWQELGIPFEDWTLEDLAQRLPIYDRTELDGFYVAIGTSGNQFKNTGVAGHVMAELITAVEGGLDHDRDPLVIEGRYTGLPIEVGFFSRNRDPAATSMSVFA